jgi:uncharacterized membrane protein YdjX (TVP38/TMEM64 family)
MDIKKLYIPILIIIGSMGLFIFPLLDFYYHWCPDCSEHHIFSVEVFKLYVLHFDFWAMAFYVFLFTINTISLLPPILPLSLAAGIIFGPVKGTLALSLGTFFGTTATFIIARFFDEKFVEELIQGKAKEFEEKLDKNGFWVTLFIRLFPILPWEFVNYAAGLSTMKYRDYILGTMIGIFPWMAIVTYLANSLWQAVLVGGRKGLAGALAQALGPLMMIG